MDRSELFKIGERLRRGARGELLDYIDGTIGFLRGEVMPHSTESNNASARDHKTKPQPLLLEGKIAFQSKVGAELLPAFKCSICEARRKLKALQMKRYRSKKRGL